MASETPQPDTGRAVRDRVKIYVPYAVSLGAALVLDLGIEPDWSGQIAEVLLWSFAILSMGVVGGALIAFMSEHGERLSKRVDDKWRSVNWAERLIRRLLMAVLLFLLVDAGQLALAALILFSMLTKITLRFHHRIIDHDDQLPYWLWFDLCVYLLVGGLLLFVTLLVVNPIIFAFELRNRRRTKRGAGRLCELFERPHGLVYFAYSEPHQRECFLGENGVLAPYREHVIERDWRRDIALKRKGADREHTLEEPECWLLGYCKITNMGDDLPFVAVVEACSLGDWFVASEAYRARRRDGAVALGKLEESIGTALAEAFGPPAEPAGCLEPGTPGT